MTRLCTFLAVPLLLAGLSSCTPPGKSSTSSGSTAAAVAPIEREIVIPVEAQPPSRGTISAYFETTSRVTAENRVEVAAKASGSCTEIRAEEGDVVREGQVLAVLYQPEALQALSAAEIQVPHRKIEFERAQKGFDLGLNSQAELDSARASYEQAKSNVEQQQVQVDNLTVRAPISGVITTRTIQLGQLVQAGQSVFTMVDPQSFILSITPPEQELPRLRQGQIAQVNIDALGGKLYEAKVRRINPAVDRVTGTINVVLDFDRETREQLVDAAFARVRLIMETRHDALLVPKDAIVEENARKYLFLVRPPTRAGAETTAAVGAETGKEESAAPAVDAAGAASGANVAERVEVRVGLEDRQHVEIVSGLNDDDLVVTVGQHNLKSGTKIDVTNMDDALMAKIAMNADEALQEARAKRAAEEAQDAEEGGRRGGRRMR